MNHTRHTTLILILSVSTLAAASLSGCATTQPRSDSTAPAKAGDGVVHTTSEADHAYLSSKAPIDAERVTLAVNGLSCPLCATNVDKQLQGIRGVGDVKIDFAKGEIDLMLTDPRPSPSTLARAIDRAGFTLVKISRR